MEASIVEAKWNYPRSYFFHTYGLQEVKKNMGQIKVFGKRTEITEAKLKIQNNNGTFKKPNSDQSKNFL